MSYDEKRDRLLAAIANPVRFYYSNDGEEDEGEEYKPDFTDDLYGYTWRGRNTSSGELELHTEILRAALKSENQDILLSALFIAEEVGYADKNHELYKDLLRFNNEGNADGQYVFLYYVKDTKIEYDEIIDFINDYFNVTTAVLRQLAIQVAAFFQLKNLEKLGKKLYGEEYRIASHSQFDDWNASRNRAKRAFRIVLLIRAGMDAEQILELSLYEDPKSIEYTVSDCITRKLQADINLNDIGL